MMKNHENRPKPVSIQPMWLVSIHQTSAQKEELSTILFEVINPRIRRVCQQVGKPGEEK